MSYPPPSTVPQALFEMYFVFAAIWAFGGALVEKDGIDYRRRFDKWWKATWTTVKIPGRGRAGEEGRWGWEYLGVPRLCEQRTRQTASAFPIEQGVIRAWYCTWLAPCYLSRQGNCV